MIVIVEDVISAEELALARQEHGDYVKVVVDIEKDLLAAGGEWHADAEKMLLEMGSLQDNLWGGGVDLTSSVIEFTSLINMRPKLSRSQEVLDMQIRDKMERVIRRVFGL